MLFFPLWKRIVIWGLVALGVIFAAPNLFYERVELANDMQAAGEDSDWPGFLPSGLVNLGLDLRGGAHLLVEVKLEDVHKERILSLFPEAVRALREVRDQVGTVRKQASGPDELVLRIGEASGMNAALEAIRGISRPVGTFTGGTSRDIEVSGQGDLLTITLSEAELAAMDTRTMAQSLEIIRRRVDEAGTREPTIQRQGADRILVQVPGLGSSEELLELLGTTAKLTFHPVVSFTSDPQARAGARNILLPFADRAEQYAVLTERPVITGENLVDAAPAFDQNNRPAVNFRLNPAGGRIFGEYTAENIGQPFAIVLDGEIISAPTIQSHIAGGSGIITGDFSVEESTRLAVLLRAGALPAELTVLEERTIGPELGQDSIEAGRLASVVAFVLVLIFMALSYGRFGIFADIALVFNVACLFALLSMIGATLTLPGIAGIVLTIGMAVDANVLIFERIREELKTAKGPARAIELGYERAFSAIVDANITTFIAALILFMMGSGPVRGFAITLGLGILTSLFTAVYVTRLMIATWFAHRRPKQLEV